ncbi:MAG: protein phosphatase 2C domain-containing protein [Anaerolineae bacterium]
MPCAICGRENRPEAGFCAWCGSSLAAAPAGTQEPVATEQSEDSQVDWRVAGAVTRKLDPRELGLGGPLELGATLDERYEIVELVTETPDNRVYRAFDRRRCPGCGRTTDPASLAPFCEVCGAQLDPPAQVTILEYLVQRPESYDGHFEHGGRDYYVVIDPPNPIDQIVHGPGKRLVFGSATHMGYQYDHNEDSLDARLYADHRGAMLGYFVVADGVGGQQGGEIASQYAISATWRSLYEGLWQMAFRGEEIGEADAREGIADAIAAANAAVYAERAARHSDMTTTITLALVIGRRVYIGNLGDSRTYLWDAQGLHRVTKDHSLVQRLVDTGQIQPEEVYTHPRRNIIYQSLGDRPDTTPDVYTAEIGPDARLLLCSDGLWEMVREEGIEEVLLAEPDAQRAADRLTQNALLAGGADNIAVIIVQIER